MHNFEYQSSVNNSEKSDSGFSCQCGQFSVAYVAETDERTNVSCGCGCDTTDDVKDEQVYMNEKGVST